MLLDRERVRLRSPPFDFLPFLSFFPFFRLPPFSPLPEKSLPLLVTWLPPVPPVPVVSLVAWPDRPPLGEVLPLPLPEVLLPYEPESRLPYEPADSLDEYLERLVGVPEVPAEFLVPVVSFEEYLLRIFLLSDA